MSKEEEYREEDMNDPLLEDLSKVENHIVNVLEKKIEDVAKELEKALDEIHEIMRKAVE